MAINRALIVAFYDAANFLDDIRNTYRQAKAVQTKIALYQAGTNPQFNSAVNAIIPAADRQRIALLKPFLDVLINEYETNYQDFINPPE